MIGTGIHPFGGFLVRSLRPGLDDLFDRKVSVFGRTEVVKQVEGREFVPLPGDCLLRLRELP
jgi:hypothetical protein